MPLVQRVNQVAEYSEFISTKPSRKGHSAGRHVRFAKMATVWHVSAHEAITAEASDWFEAVCPTVKDIQGVVRRVQENPNMTQDEIFCFLYPLYMFALLIGVTVVALQPKSFAHHVLLNPLHHLPALVFGAVAFAVVLMAGTALLRVIIWGVARLAGMVADANMERAAPSGYAHRRVEPPTSLSAVLAGIFSQPEIDT